MIKAKVHKFIIGALFSEVSLISRNKSGYCIYIQIFERGVSQCHHHHSFGLSATIC